MSDLFDSQVAMMGVIAHLVDKVCGGYLCVTQEQIAEAVAKYNLASRIELDPGDDRMQDKVHIMTSTLTKAVPPTAH